GFRLAAAPTPIAALWLARGAGQGAGRNAAQGAGRNAGRGAGRRSGAGADIAVEDMSTDMNVRSLDALPSRLGRLPLSVTGWPEGMRERLAGMGITTIGDVSRLPRGGFARRFGKAYLDTLDKALGRRADPRADFEAPRHLGFEVELA